MRYMHMGQVPYTSSGCANSTATACRESLCPAITQGCGQDWPIGAAVDMCRVLYCRHHVLLYCGEVYCLTMVWHLPGGYMAFQFMPSRCSAVFCKAVHSVKYNRCGMQPFVTVNMAVQHAHSNQQERAPDSQASAPCIVLDCTQVTQQPETHKRSACMHAFVPHLERLPQQYIRLLN
jgi:hypothetical protein